MRLAVLVALAACGRSGFDPLATGDGSAGRGDGDGGVTTGPSGPRWLKKLGIDSEAIEIAGMAGELAAVTRFTTTTFSGDEVSLTAQGYINSALVRYSPDGAVLESVLLDSGGMCDMRGVASVGATYVLSGYTLGNGMFGTPCSLATNRQDPVVMEYDPQTRAMTVAVHYVAGGSNAQGWGVGVFGDGNLVTGGIYGGDLTAGTSVPTAMVDPNTWLAAPDAADSAGSHWALALNPSTEVHGGPVVARGTSAFAAGAFLGSPTILGHAVTSAGGYDEYLTRIDQDGTVQWVNTIGSTADEPNFGNDLSLAPLPDGGVAVGVRVEGDATIDGQLFPASAGSGLVLRYDANGALVGGMRLPSVPWLAAIGDRLFAAVTQDGDAVILELGPNAPIATIGSIGGGGAQQPRMLMAIGPDVLGFSVVSTGALSFGDTSFDSGADNVRAVGAIGL